MSNKQSHYFIRKIIGISVLGLILFCCSCGDKNSICGTWRKQITSIGYWRGMEDGTETVSYYYYIFNDDHTGYTVFPDPFESEADWEQSIERTFSYELSEKEVIIDWGNGVISNYDYDLNGNKMSMKDINTGEEMKLEKTFDR